MAHVVVAGHDEELLEAPAVAGTGGGREARGEVAKHGRMAVVDEPAAHPVECGEKRGRRLTGDGGGAVEGQVAGQHRGADVEPGHGVRGMVDERQHRKEQLDRG